MKRTMFALIAAAVVVSTAAAADVETSRSVGASPVVYDDYPESDVVMDIGPDVVLTVTGEARTRFEWYENTTDFSDHGTEDESDDDDFDDANSYTAARFNLGIRVDLPRDVAAVIELQGNFDFGGGNSIEDRVATTMNQRPGTIRGGFHSSFGPGQDLPGGVGSGSDGGSDDDIPGSPFLQDARESLDGNGDGVFVYQGYLEAAHIGDSIFSMRFGRQELAYGTEWLLGNQDFYDGQTFDGIKGIFEFSDNHRLDLFWAKLYESETDFFTDDYDAGDYDLYGAYFSAQSLGGSSVGMDAYVIGANDDRDSRLHIETLDFDGDDHADGVGTFHIDDNEEPSSYLSAWWAGLRFFREREHGFHFSAEATYLFGDIEADLVDIDGDDHDEFDLSAFGFEGWWGYTWNTPTNPTIRGNITYASGSDANDLDGGNYNTFFTPAGEVHPRLGLMDLVDASNVIAGMLGYTGSFERHSWGVDIWHFEVDEVDPFLETNFIDEGELADGHGFDNEIGQELDLWYNYQYSEHMLAQFAIGYFNAGSLIEEIQRCGDADDDCDLDDDPDFESRSTDDAWRVYANLLVRF